MKVDEFALFLRTNNVDIDCITETWLKSTVPSSAINIAGYSVVRNDRHNEIIGGGVCVYIRNTIRYKLWTELLDDDVESLWITIRPKRLPRDLSMITLGVIYMPPGSSIRPRKETQYVTHILHSLDTIMRSYPDSGLFVVGDFNHMKDKHIKNFPLKQIVQLPMHVTSILDCIYTNIDQYYKTPELSPGLGLSLHKVVQCEPNLIAPNKRAFTQTYRTNSQSARSAFVDALKVVNWQPIFRMATCQEMYTCFNNTIQELLTVHLPFITTTKFETDKPWITEDYKRDISQRQHYLKVGDTVNFNRLRNIVNRKTKSLCSLHYKHKVRSLNSENSR